MKMSSGSDCFFWMPRNCAVYQYTPRKLRGGSTADLTKWPSGSYILVVLTITVSGFTSSLTLALARSYRIIKIFYTSRVCDCFSVATDLDSTLSSVKSFTKENHSAT
jgi:hypothetical protein